MIPDSSTPPAAMPAPAPSIGSRPPRRASIRLETTAPTAIADRHRHHVQARVSADMAPHVLQVQGGQEQEAAEGGEGADRRQHGPRERRAAEEPRVEHRLGTARLVGHEDRESRDATANSVRMAGACQPSAGPSMIA